MELIQAFILNDIDTLIWPPFYQGFFYYDGEYIKYYYENGRELMCTRLNDEGIITTYSCCSSKTLYIPSIWRFISGHIPSIICGDRHCLSLKTDTLLEMTEKMIQENQVMYDRSINVGNIAEEYHFDPYTVSRIGECGYKCKAFGKEVWKIGRIQGYLYTDIYRYLSMTSKCNENSHGIRCSTGDRKDYESSIVGYDHIVFGTDGMGGRLCIIELATGKIIAEINTGGTSQIVVCGDVCYCLCRVHNKSKIIKVSLGTGRIVDECSIPGIATSYSRLYMNNNILYLTSFKMKAGDPVNVWIVLCKI